MDLIEKFNLPSYVKGKSFAEASKSIMDKFKDRKDQTSMKTMAQLLGRLKDAQEFTKQQEEKSNSNDFFFGGMMGGNKPQQASQNPAMNSNTIIAGDPKDNQMVDGVKDSVASVTGPFGQLFRGIQKAGQGIGDAVGGDTGAVIADIFSPEESTMAVLKDEDASTWEKIGGIVPGLGGVIAKNLKEKKIQKAQANAAHLKRNMAMGNFANGGFLNTDPKTKKEIVDLTPEQQKALDAKLKSQKIDEGIFSNSAVDYDPWGTGGIFGTIKTTTSDAPAHNLNLGKYKDVGYFDVKVDDDGYYTLYNTQKNPANADLYKKQLENIQKLNPGAKIQRNNLSGYRPLSKQNNFRKGGRPETKSVNELEVKGYDFPSPESLLEIPNLKPLNTTKSAENTDPSFLQKAGDWLNKNKYDIGRTAPIISNAAQLLNMKRPEKESLAKLGNRYNKQLADEETYINKINNSISSDLATEASGGSRSKAFSNARALQRDKIAAISDAYDRIASINRQEGSTEQQFNLGIDEFNTRTRQLESENFARDKGAYETEKSKFISALGKNIGDFGTERERDEMIKQLFDYTRKGDYIKKKAKGGYLDEAISYMATKKKGTTKKK